MIFLAIIPARFASTRFEGKPLVDIFGLPMVVHVYRKACEEFINVVIATDNLLIKDCAERHGCKVIMTSENHKSGTDRCAEALLKYCELTGQKIDIVVNIQGDEPFVHIEQLQQIKSCFEDTSTQLATLVKVFGDNEDIFNSNTPKVVLNDNSEAIYFSRNAIPYLRNQPKQIWQSLHTYYKHIGLYAYNTKVLEEITSLKQSPLEICESLEQLRWIEAGYKIKCAVTNYQSHAIDTPEDLVMVLDLYK